MGSGSNNGSGSNATPAATASIDKATVATELGKTETITVSVKSSGGFTGDVTLTPALTDATGTPLTNLTVTASAPKVTLTADGTATATFMVAIPTDATGADLAATLKVHATSTAGSQDLTSAVNVAAVLTLNYDAGIGNDATKHPSAGVEVKVKAGAKVHLHNADAISHITHGDGAWPHETTNVNLGGLPNGTYEILTAGKAVGTTGTVGCHSHSANNTSYHKLTID
ncbi:MAG TPA: hypothetical protein VGC42_12895 [Kofleriaceae bacterium]